MPQKKLVVRGYCCKQNSQLRGVRKASSATSYFALQRFVCKVVWHAANASALGMSPLGCHYLQYEGLEDLGFPYRSRGQGEPLLSLQNLTNDEIDHVQCTAAEGTDNIPAPSNWHCTSGPGRALYTRKHKRTESGWGDTLSGSTTAEGRAAFSSPEAAHLTRRVAEQTVFASGLYQCNLNTATSPCQTHGPPRCVPPFDLSWSLHSLHHGLPRETAELRPRGYHSKSNSRGRDFCWGSGVVAGEPRGTLSSLSRET